MRFMALTVKQYTNPPSEMLDAMAMGKDSYAHIGAQYGWTEDELNELAGMPHMQTFLAKRAQELHENGFTRKYVNSNFLQMLEMRVYERAMFGEVTHGQLLDTTKYFRETVEPKNAPVTSNAGTGFSINIILKDRNGHKTTIHAEAPPEAAPIEGEATVVRDVVEGQLVKNEVDAFDELPEVPAFLADKRVTANSDLSESV